MHCEVMIFPISCRKKAYENLLFSGHSRVLAPSTHASRFSDTDALTRPVIGPRIYIHGALGPRGSKDTTIAIFHA